MISYILRRSTPNKTVTELFRDGVEGQEAVTLMEKKGQKPFAQLFQRFVLAVVRELRILRPTIP